MGAFKRLIDDRADAGRCVMCGAVPDEPVPFMSGTACAICEAEYARDLDRWTVEQTAARIEAAKQTHYAKGGTK